MDYNYKTVPDQHQIDALKRALQRKRFGLFFQQRVGKTKVALDFCGVTYLETGRNKTLIICPLSVRTEWVSQIEEHYPYSNVTHVYPKQPEKRFQLLIDTRRIKKPIFIIINYDILSSDLPRFINWKADTIIFDESHMIGRHTSKRSIAAADLTKDVENVLLLTGTPIPKKWYHIFGQFRAMNPNIFGTSFRNFIDKWGVRGGYKRKEIIGCVDYNRLSQVIARHSIRVLRKDVFNEPNVENIIIPIEFSPSARKVYNDLKKYITIELSNQTTVTVEFALTLIMRLQQVCGGFIKTDDGTLELVSEDKLKTAKDLIYTKLEGDEQVVVFYRFTAEGKALYDMCSKLSDKPVVEINGRVSEENRKKARDMFQAGKSEIILIQIATGAMGISLDKSHINIFYSLDFSLSNFQQARDRVMGRNQQTDVTNYFLAIEYTVDYKIMNTLRKDEDIASLISNSWRWVLKED